MTFSAINQTTSVSCSNSFHGSPGPLWLSPPSPPSHVVLSLPGLALSSIPDFLDFSLKLWVCSGLESFLLIAPSAWFSFPPDLLRPPSHPCLSVLRGHSSQDAPQQAHPELCSTPHLTLSFLSFVLLFGHMPSVWKFPGWGLNQSCSCRPMPQPQPQPHQRRIWAVSTNYTRAHGNTRSLTHWARPGIEPAPSWIPVGLELPVYFSSQYFSSDILLNSCCVSFQWCQLLQTGTQCAWFTTVFF